LGQLHLAKIVGVGQVNLFKHGLAVGESQRGRTKKQERSKYSGDQKSTSYPTTADF